MNRPVVLVGARRTSRKNKLIDYVGELHLELLVRLRILPVIVPVVAGTESCLPQYMESMDGLLLVEGEDIEPKRFAARKANVQYLEKTHPLKDEIEIQLVRRALRRHVPILGICRGSQLLNVVCGGTLYGDVQKEKGSHRPHINYHNYDTYRHPLSVVPGTPLARWYRRKTLQVNSYHHQGIRELARRFRPMAYADDGLIEAYYDPQSNFVVGLQFHPERMLKEYAGNWRVWKAFSAAVHRAYRSRSEMATKAGRNFDRPSKRSVFSKSTGAYA
jgi:gamma-glutamyl-gamma-aminobutyrate hydrolase PuuD